MNNIDAEAKEATKAAISRILLETINGIRSENRTEDGFIRWGKVERDIHQVIDDFWPQRKQ